MKAASILFYIPAAYLLYAGMDLWLYVGRCGTPFLSYLVNCSIFGALCVVLAVGFLIRDRAGKVGRDAALRMIVAALAPAGLVFFLRIIVSLLL